MKRIIKKFGKCLIIYVAMIMLFLSNVCYGYTQEEAGTAIAQTAAYIVNNYQPNIEYSQGYRVNNPIWGGDSYSWTEGTNYFDCSSFASGVVHSVTGLFDEAQSTDSLDSLSSTNFEKGEVNSVSDVKLGDIVFWRSGSGHATLYVGDYGTEDLAECGGKTSDSVGYRDLEEYISYCHGKGRTLQYVRVSEEAASQLTSLNTEFCSGSISNSSSSIFTSVDLSNFYFNGIPDGKYSVAHTSILTAIFETLASIADYIIGILTYGIRASIVGLTAAFDYLFTWTINTVVNTGTTSSELDMSSIEVTSADNDTRITLEKLFYNGLELVDINIFDIDT